MSFSIELVSTIEEPLPVVVVLPSVEIAQAAYAAAERAICDPKTKPIDVVRLKSLCDRLAMATVAHTEIVSEAPSCD